MCIQELKVFLQDFVFSNSNEESDFQEKGLSFPLFVLIGSYLIMMKKTRQRFKFMEFGGLHEMMILFGITP